MNDLIIYIYLLVIPFIVHFLFGKSNKKLEVVINSLVLILFVGLRSEDVGSDTLRYATHFKEIASWDFDFMKASAIAHESPFYVAFAWIISRISVSIPFYFCAVALLHYWSLGRLVLKYSTNIPFSYFLYCCLFLTLQLSGIKNTLTTAFIFLAIDMAIEKKLWKHLLFVFIAVLFHRTSAIILVIYPLINCKLKFKSPKLTFAGIYISLLAIFFIFRVQISNMFKVIGGYTDYGIHEAAPLSMTFLCIAIVVLGMFANSGERKFWSELSMCSVASIFMPLVFVNPSALRIVRYFLCMAIFLIPESIKNLDKKLKIRNINIAIASLLIAILGWQFLNTFSGESVYLYNFFWE